MNSKCKTNRKLWLRHNALTAPPYRLLGGFLLIVLLLAGVPRRFIWAGTESGLPQGLEPGKVAATIKANAQALKAFSHQQRMQLQLKGDTKKVTLTQINYDMNGNEQKTLLSEQPPPDQEPSGGRLKQRIVAKKKGEFKQMMQEIAALIKSYTELPPDQLQAALKQGSFSAGEGDMAGSVQIQLHNVVQQGDSLTIWIDRTTTLFRRAVIATNYEGNPVTATANYATLPTGQVYNAQTILNYPKKEVVVELDNMNYQQGPAQTTASTGADTANPTESASMSASELQGLVAPIALYPDALVAQILGAATFPDQVAVANYWLQQNKNLTGSTLTQAVDKQSWDGSVKALTAFPTVLDNLAKNLSWTSSLGEAYHNQQAEVMTAVQTLRAQAQAKGNLKSTPQITVVQQAPQTIVIQPANPQVVYVPQYNPAVIYGYPYVTPGYSTGDIVAASAISFGAGIAVGAMMSSAWGWNSWGCDWHGGVVVCNHNSFYGNTAWHGGYYNGGYHNSYGYNNAYNRANVGNSYRGGDNTINKNVSGNTVNVGKQGGQNVSADRSAASNSLHDSGYGGKSSAYSGLSGHSDGFGDAGGWSSRAESNRGWGSMRASGFSGGRFGGGAFGGGGFRGRR